MRKKKNIVLNLSFDITYLVYSDFWKKKYLFSRANYEYFTWLYTIEIEICNLKYIELQ
jgi:hypothetical protein